MGSAVQGGWAACLFVGQLVVALAGVCAMGAGVAQATKPKRISSRTDVAERAIISSRAQLATHLVPSERSFSHIKFVGKKGDHIVLQSLRTNRFYVATETENGGDFVKYAFKPVEERDALAALSSRQTATASASEANSHTTSSGKSKSGSDGTSTITSTTTPRQKKAGPPQRMTLNAARKVLPKRPQGGPQQRIRKPNQGPAVVLSDVEAKQLGQAIAATTDPVLLVRLLSVQLYAKGLTYSEIARQINHRPGLRTDRHTVLRVVDRFAALPSPGEGNAVESRIERIADNLEKGRRVKKRPLTTAPLFLQPHEWRHLMAIYLLSTTPAAEATSTFWSWFLRGAMVGLHESNVNGQQISEILAELGFAGIHRKTPGSVVRRVQSFEKRHPELENERLLELIGHGQPQWRFGKSAVKGELTNGRILPLAVPISPTSIDSWSDDVVYP